MNDIHISDFLRSRTQKQVAEIMGITQGAVHQALGASRDIYFRPKEDGTFDYYEIKKPRKKNAA